MSIVTLRPNGTWDDYLVSLSGGTLLHDLISDDLSATYVLLSDNSSYFIVDFEEHSAIAGTVLKKVDVRARVAVESGKPSTMRTTLVLTPPESKLSTLYVTYPGATTVTTLTATQGQLVITDAGLDVARVKVGPFSGGLRVYELYFDVTYVVPAKVTVTGPSGVLATTNQPTVEWEGALDSDGGSQTYYEVKVFDKATYEGGGFDPDTSTPVEESGITAGNATEWTGESALAEDAFRAYVRVAQTVNSEKLWSSWAYSAFVVSTKTPAVPTLEVTPEDADAVISLSLADGGGGEVETDGFQAQWSQDGGATWTNVRTEDGEGSVEGTEATLYDYEAPNGTAVKYRARAWHDYEVAKAYSEWAEATGTWESGDRWLKHPTNPALNMTVLIHTYPSFYSEARRGVFQPIGRTDPVVVSDTRHARTGQLVLWIETQDDRDALDAILDTLDPLLLQLTPEDTPPDRWLVLGDHSGASIVDKLQVDDSLETLDWVEVGRP